MVGKMDNPKYKVNMRNTIIENTNLYIAEKDITVYIPIVKCEYTYRIIESTPYIDFDIYDGVAKKRLYGRELCKLIDDTKQECKGKNFKDLHKFEQEILQKDYYTWSDNFGIHSYLDAKYAQHIVDYYHYKGNNNASVLIGYVRKGTRYYNGWGKVESKYSPSVDRDILNYSIPKIVSEEVWLSPSDAKEKMLDYGHHLFGKCMF